MLKHLLIRLEGLLQDREAEIKDLKEKSRKAKGLAAKISDEYGISDEDKLLEALDYWRSTYHIRSKSSPSHY